jgi:hypothetical protein
VTGHPEGLRRQGPYSGVVTIETSLFWNGSGDPPDAIRADPLLDAFHRPGIKSPAIDTGTPLPWLSTDLQGDSRPEGGGYDIGAYEGAGAGVFLPVVANRGQ